MSWAVHRLQSILLSLTLNPKDILFVFIIMTRIFPKFGAVNVWTDDLIITSNLILSSHKFLKSTINNSAVRIKQSRSRRKGGKVE